MTVTVPSSATSIVDVEAGGCARRRRSARPRAGRRPARAGEEEDDQAGQASPHEADVASSPSALEAERRGVHAVAVAGGLRAVGEDVAEVGATGRAADLGADHEVRAVLDELDLGRVDGLPEARPPAAGVELHLGAEQRRVAHDAVVGAGVLGVPVLAAEGPLGARVLGDLVLQRGEPLLQLVVARDLRLRSSPERTAPYAGRCEAAERQRSEHDSRTGCRRPTSGGGRSVTEYVPPLDDMRFLLEHVVDLDGLSKLEPFGHADAETVFGALEEFGRLMTEVWSPTNVGRRRRGHHLRRRGDPPARPGSTRPTGLYQEAGWPAVAVRRRPRRRRASPGWSASPCRRC